jgi:hypothetical protein
MLFVNTNFLLWRLWRQIKIWLGPLSFLISSVIFGIIFAPLLAQAWTLDLLFFFSWWVVDPVPYLGPLLIIIAALQLVVLSIFMFRLIEVILLHLRFVVSICSSCMIISCLFNLLLVVIHRLWYWGYVCATALFYWYLDILSVFSQNVSSSIVGRGIQSQYKLIFPHSLHHLLSLLMLLRLLLVELFRLRVMIECGSWRLLIAMISVTDVRLSHRFSLVLLDRRPWNYTTRGLQCRLLKELLLYKLCLINPLFLVWCLLIA